VDIRFVRRGDSLTDQIAGDLGVARLAGVQAQQLEGGGFQGLVECVTVPLNVPKLASSATPGNAVAVWPLTCRLASVSQSPPETPTQL